MGGWIDMDMNTDMDNERYVAYLCLFLCAYVDNSIHGNTHRYDCISVHRSVAIDLSEATVGH